MENTEKLRVLLQHWIDHNKGHNEEFLKWQETMVADNCTKVAEHIAGAMEKMKEVNGMLEKALTEVGGPKEGEGHHHHHHHDHDHHHH